ncbi:MAG: carboxymuconolactone decarboxylase family protein [Methanomicrobiales archaeon]
MTLKEDIDVDEIFKKIENYFGFIPKIFLVLSENPPLLKSYFEKSVLLMENNALPPLTKELISIGAASSLGSEHCLSTHISVAKKFGATKEQILLSILIGGFINETSALSKSLRVFESLYD